jgi:hypothetical protein
MFTRQGIAQILAQGASTVKFTKLDGDERVMHCTIAEHLIPQDKMPYNRTPDVDYYGYPKQPNLAVLKVFDLDANEWRSFRVNSVKEVSVGYDNPHQTELLLG